MQANEQLKQQCFQQKCIQLSEKFLTRYNSMSDFDGAV